MSEKIFEGKCTCGKVTYHMTSKPMFVNCCHCSWCQRETGSAFVINAMIEADRVKVNGEVEVIHTPSNSGKGQKISRCPTCKVALWSNYGGGGDLVRFVRVGALLNPMSLPPDIHIYTTTKLPWVKLTGDVPVMDEYYDRQIYWPKESLARREALFKK